MKLANSVHLSTFILQNSRRSTIWPRNQMSWSDAGDLYQTVDAWSKSGHFSFEKGIRDGGFQTHSEGQSQCICGLRWKDVLKQGKTVCIQHHAGHNKQITGPEIWSHGRSFSTKRHAGVQNNLQVKNWTKLFLPSHSWRPIQLPPSWVSQTV